MTRRFSRARDIQEAREYAQDVLENEKKIGDAVVNLAEQFLFLDDYIHFKTEPR